MENTALFLYASDGHVPFISDGKIFFNFVCFVLSFSTGEGERIHLSWNDVVKLKNMVPVEVTVTNIIELVAAHFLVRSTSSKVLATFCEF